MITAIVTKQRQQLDHRRLRFMDEHTHTQNQQWTRMRQFPEEENEEEEEEEEKQNKNKRQPLLCINTKTLSQTKKCCIMKTYFEVNVKQLTNPRTHRQTQTHTHCENIEYNQQSQELSSNDKILRKQIKHKIDDHSKRTQHTAIGCKGRLQFVAPGQKRYHRQFYI